jgi:3-deoxy-D-manno-octulosonic-acid transferase
VIHGLYTAVLTGVMMAYAPLALGRRLTSGVPLNLRARLGYDVGSRPAGPSGWIHAVSVGESITAAPLVAGLRERYPDLPLVVTTVTETGARVVRERLGAVAEHRYFPLDLPGAIRRVVDAIDPAFLVCMETELWPNLLRALHSRGVPVMIANGRLSDRSFRRYALVGALMRPMLGPVRVFAMQSQEDARRIVALGACPERVVVTGNMKHDAVPGAAAMVDGWRQRLGLARAQRVWVAGSTHRGEEEAVLEAHAAARGDHADLVLVIAPRHPERAGEVQALIEARGWPAVRRSALPATGGAGAVVILDTVGELAELYGVADTVFVGGSLVASGGHNMLEPARLHKAVLFGPHTSNFREAAAALAASGGGFVVSNAAELGARLRHLLTNHAERERAGEAAHAAVISRQGAVQRTLDLLSPLVDAAAETASRRTSKGGS